MPFPKNIARATLLPLFYLLACSSIAALLALPLFELTNGDGGRYFRSLVSRGAQVVLLVGVYGIGKRLGFTWQTLGFSEGFPRQWGMGFAAGVLMLGLHASGLIALNIRAVNGDVLSNLGRTLNALGSALATGFAVALLEEIIFRGVLFAYLRMLSGPVVAVIVSALYYAGLHFLRSDWSPAVAEIGWDTGFRVVGAAFAHLAEAKPDAFLALLVPGLLLGCVRAVVPGGLGYCMGLHAGWVFVIKLVKPLTHVVPDARWSFLVSDYDRVIGILSSLWLGVLLLLFLAAVKRVRHF